MQYLQYFENYDEEGLVRKFYENALYHDDLNALKKVNNKYDTNALDFINTEEIIEYNANSILEYLLKQGLEIKFDDEYFKKHIINKGKFKIAKTLYNNDYFVDHVYEKRRIFILDKNINTLEGIEVFKNLKHLNCTDNYIKSLEPIENLNIRILECTNNEIESLEPIKNMYDLKVLHSPSNNIKTIKPIEHLLPNLNQFNMMKNPLNEESIEILTNTKNIDSFTF